MSAPESTLNPAASGEVKTESKPVPILLFGLLILTFYLGFVYLDIYGGFFNEQVYQPYTSFAQVDEAQVVDPEVQLRIRGMKIFNVNCSPCHQGSGLGVAGQFPPLVASEWVNAKGPNRILRAVLCGLGGPISVKGQPYNNNMVPWKDVLKDDEIAAVLTFIRQNKEWSNDASAVTPEQVAAIRTKVKDHTSAFTADELLKIPDTE